MTDEKLREMLRAGAAPADPPPGARERTWARLQAAPAPSSRLVPALALGLAAAAAIGLAVMRRPAERAPEPRMPVVATSGEVERGDAFVETGDGQALVGRAHDSFAWVAEGSRFATAGDSRVKLTRGVVRVWAAHRRAGETFEVRTPRHRVVVVGTVFTVRAEGDDVAVWVANGVVEVWSGDERAARLTAGESWSSDGIEPATMTEAEVTFLEGAGRGGETRIPESAAPEVAVAEPAPVVDEEPAVAIEAEADAAPVRERPHAPATPSRSADVVPAPSPEPAPETATPALRPAESAEDVLAREAQSLEQRGQFAEAARRYQTLGAGNGQEAGWALYRLGRARHRMGDEGGALAALQAYRQRFAGGPLRHEVDLSVVEVELARGHNAAALREVEAFLARWPRSERRAEMERLRARLEEIE